MEKFFQAPQVLTPAHAMKSIVFPVVKVELVAGVNQQPLVHQFRTRPFKAFLGMNQKHILFPCTWIFQPSYLPQNFLLLPTSPPSYLPPTYLLPTYLTPPTSLSSFPTHSISKAWESSQA
jgi:hypothetical protein